MLWWWSVECCCWWGSGSEELLWCWFSVFWWISSDVIVQFRLAVDVFRASEGFLRSILYRQINPSTVLSTTYHTLKYYEFLWKTQNPFLLLWCFLRRIQDTRQNMTSYRFLCMQFELPAKFVSVSRFLSQKSGDVRNSIYMYVDRALGIRIN